MNGYDFRTALALICPDYDIQQDNYGQIIIYTGMKEVDEDTYVAMTDSDFDIDPEALA
jgi:hypothetical protein